MSNDMYENEENEENEVNVEKPSLLGMITDPRTQFERIRMNPKILVPFIIITVLTAIGMLFMMSQIDLIGDDPYFNSMGEEELMYMTIFTQITFVITGLLTPAISILISTVVYLIIAKIVKSAVSFKQLFSMATFIYIISVLSIFVNALAFLAISNPDPNLLLTSLNSLVEAEGALGAFLVSIEIFTIWGMILSAIGLQIVAKFSKGLSWGIVIGIFVIITSFSMVSIVVTDMLGAF